MPKIYTKTGDKGQTSMLGGKRVSKSCLEMEAIGEVDELNALLGMLIEEIDVIPAKAGIQKQKKPNKQFIDSRLRGNDNVVEELINIQNNLFVIGANLAALQSPSIKTCKLTNLQTYKIERWIDKMTKELPELKNFILPGGCEEAVLAFYVRAVCRRAERRVIGLGDRYKVPEEIIKYLNRLSDLLFTLGRWFNFKNGAKEVKWKK